MRASAVGVNLALMCFVGAIILALGGAAMVFTDLTPWATVPTMVLGGIISFGSFMEAITQ